LQLKKSSVDENLTFNGAVKKKKLVKSVVEKTAVNLNANFSNLFHQQVSQFTCAVKINPVQRDSLSLFLLLLEKQFYATEKMSSALEGLIFHSTSYSQSILWNDGMGNV
jgi:hypothetical protein